MFLFYCGKGEWTIQLNSHDSSHTNSTVIVWKIKVSTMQRRSVRQAVCSCYCWQWCRLLRLRVLRSCLNLSRQDTTSSDKLFPQLIYNDTLPRPPPPNHHEISFKCLRVLNLVRPPHHHEISFKCLKGC